MKHIEGYENLYAVTENGDIVSLRTGKNLKLNFKKNGYVHVELNKRGIAETLRVHRLVAKAYIEKIEGKEYVNHINGIKSDNRVENLEWVTASENNIHSCREGFSKKPEKMYYVTDTEGVTTKVIGHKNVQDFCRISKGSVNNYLDTGRYTRTGYMLSSTCNDYPATE